MYDTVFLKLTKAEAGEVDFLEETACFLDNIGEHLYGDCPVITGNINGLKVIANRYQIKVKDGSLCKFLFGDNFQTMKRSDTQKAIEKLSDTLHLPMDKATVTRMDIAQNLVMDHPASVYFNHLGELRYAARLQEPDGIYYKVYEGRLCFYDKCREQKSKHESIPEIYEGKNVLRYERRYEQKVAKKFKVQEVTGRMLYDESFYMSALKGWETDYQAIKKINDTTLNFQAMKTRQQFYRMGVLSLIERMGGQLEMLNEIKEAQKRGELSYKQAHDLRAAVNNACLQKEGLTVPNGAIQELDRKIAEAVCNQ